MGDAMIIASLGLSPAIKDNLDLFIKKIGGFQYTEPRKKVVRHFFLALLSFSAWPCLALA